ncbi:cupin-like domain-containing protein [Nostoc flagelliforme FACHB-838]|uniref:Cupin-like domain-containing protein n=1 Tax=Nostoc flagelliforme FACHB-838 TaxID=2692904 RepID=A0ABR8DTV1_9NOSO|nr:cupin-like domain-containing protein [Nostoc flagelliforme FACHB-838]
MNQQQLPEEKLPKPIQEVILNAGDLLYIPSGYVHEALTSESSSLHLTVGINVYRWIDLLSTALILASEQNISLRKYLPIGFLKSNNCVKFLKQNVDSSAAVSEGRIAD